MYTTEEVYEKLADGWPNRLLFHLNRMHFQNLLRDIHVGMDRDESVVYHMTASGINVSGTSESFYASKKMVRLVTEKSGTSNMRSMTDQSRNAQDLNVTIDSANADAGDEEPQGNKNSKGSYIKIE